MSGETPHSHRFINSPPSGRGLSVRLVGGLVVLIVLISLISVYVIWFQGRPMLESLSRQKQAQLGQNITLAVGQQLRLIEGIAQSMAHVAVSLPEDNKAKAIESVIPSILNQLGSNTVIAGGGIWPEPFAFDEAKERGSFFWGRDQYGKLRYYDDYNDANGPGYHSEEWYVPARFVGGDGVYWSKSYTDPYSLQPMVTCAVPMYKEGRFVGAASVDLKLDEVSKTLERIAFDDNQYAFVVDRNNKLIAFPDTKLALTYRKTRGKRTPDFVYLSELANQEALFLPIAQALDQLEYSQFIEGKRAQQNPAQYVKELDFSSYQIDQNEARRIAAHIWSMQSVHNHYPIEVASFVVEEDYFLKEPVSVIVYQMPLANWKVVTVFKQAINREISDTISLRLVMYLGLAILCFGVAAYIVLSKGILQRLKRMSGQLQAAVENETLANIELDYRDNDELGSLVYWFNRRSAQVETARTQAEKANKAKTDFLAKMSHEFRTPLNSIIGFNRRLLKNLGPSLEPKYLEALHAINRSALHQLDMINDILDHSAIESGAINLRLGHESVNELIDLVSLQNKDLVEGKGLQFLVEKLNQDKKLVCDSKKLVQALSNLISNAVKATDSGCIKLIADESVMMGRSAVTFTVSDTGIGISDEDKKRIFKPFSQIDSRISTPGTGLGLYLTRYYIDLHGGEISLKSQIDEGAEFSVTLPLAGPMGAVSVG